MTDKELLAEIRKIIRSGRKGGAPATPVAVLSGEASRDLMRFDQIVGLLRRHENGVEDKHYATRSDQPQSDAPRLTLADSEPTQ